MRAVADPVVDPPSKEPAPGQGVLFEGVTMDYGNRSILDRLTCRFAAGEITVILGGSGSGKSTTLRLTGGLIRPAVRWREATLDPPLRPKPQLHRPNRT